MYFFSWYLTACFQLPPTEQNTKDCSLQQAVVKNKLDKDCANVVLKFAYIPKKPRKSWNYGFNFVLFSFITTAFVIQLSLDNSSLP